MAEQNSGGSSLRTSIQKLGTSLSSMIMPNIAMFIAWGLIAALFIEDGWLPNAGLAEMVGPILTYLLPIMIGFNGGKLVYQDRGGVVGAIATMGAIVGADIPMFIGAMIMGPLGGWVIKKFDQLFLDKVKTGFEMLYNNFSAGIMGAIMAIIGFYAVGPAVTVGTGIMGDGVGFIIDRGLLPLANVFIEPAKILFLNNAINHGILTPLGTEQSREFGRSILYLLEANPGPGLGVLLAYMMYGKGSSKSSAAGASLIHFLGGIHEIYFPYVMMKPVLFLAVIAGGVAGTFTFQILGAGLTSPASPGSIFAIMAMAPRGGWLPILAGVAVAAAVTFAITAIVLKADKSEEVDLDAEIAKTQAMKNQAKGLETAAADLTADQIQKVIFACDAGMGSSAMGASLLRKKFQEAGLDISVTNSAINRLEESPGLLVITQEELTPRAKQMVPSATHISVGNFLQSPKYDELVALLSGETAAEATSATAEASPATDHGQVQEVCVVYNESSRGSATMMVDTLAEILSRLDSDLVLMKLAIRDAKDQDGRLYLVPERHVNEVSLAKMETVADRIDMAELQQLMEQL